MVKYTLPGGMAIFGKLVKKCIKYPVDSVFDIYHCTLFKRLSLDN